MTTLNAFLDLSVCPVSYDAVVFLVQAKMEAEAIGASRMHVSIVGEPRKKPQYDPAEAEWRLWNIVVPAAHLFGATVSVLPDMLYAERLASAKDWKNWPPEWDKQSLKLRHHLVGGVISRFNDTGNDVPVVRASEHARRKVRQWFSGRRIVTMTFRHADYLPERNSDPLIWRQALELIRDAGFEVEVIGDTARALEIGQGYAELNLDLRVAMYEEAAFNIQANNGAASLCWFSEKPYVMFGAGVPEEEWRGLFVDQGLPLGASWPWAKGYQKIAYGPTTTNQILEYFEEWRASVGATSAS